MTNGATTPTPGDNWSPASWRSKPIKQDVLYEGAESVKKLETVLTKLRSLPPLVSAAEIERLKLSLAAVVRGEAFLLQGGPCAEVFEHCDSQKIEHEISLLLSMSLILIWGIKLPVVRIARMGGQYAKPRSSPTEMVNGVEVNSFRGDNVNGYPIHDRTPDPERLLGAYFHSAATINYVRSLLSSGFAALPTTQTESAPWTLPLAHVRDPKLQAAYVKIVQNLSEALEFMKVVGADGPQIGIAGSAEVWMSHEALLLDYEEALTRKIKIPASATSSLNSQRKFVESGDGSGFYCTSAHFVWIGDRTRAIDGAHVEFFRGLRNPIGIKVGPSMDPTELVRLLDILDPNMEPGRITLISRYGADKVEKLLPPHIEAVQRSGHPVIFSCDAMHGNTKSAAGGVKTRAVRDIISEISDSIKIHKALNSRLGGVHLELTGDIDENGFSVTECIGGSMELGEEELALRYESYCDPRLNFEQSLDVAFMISNEYASSRASSSEANHIYTELSRVSSIEN